MAFRFAGFEKSVSGSFLNFGMGMIFLEVRIIQDRFKRRRKLAENPARVDAGGVLFSILA
jgi:hypothetical protein